MKRATRTIAAGIILLLLLSLWLSRPKEQRISTAPAADKLTSSAKLPALATKRKHSSPVETQARNVDWQKRLQEISSQPDLDSQDLELLAKDIPEEEWPVVLNFLLLPDAPPAAAQLSLLLLQLWAERTPAKAADWLLRLSDDSSGHAAYSKVATIWANMNLNSAVAWLQTLADNGNKTAAQSAVASQAAEKKEAVTALNILSNLAPGEARDRLTKYSVLQWATTDRDSAVAFANKVENANLREQVLGEIAIGWGVTDPPSAAAFVATSVPAGKQQETAVANIVRFWAVRSPEQAAAWVAQFPESSLRGVAMESLTEVWARNDLVRAHEWVNQLPTGRSRDVALSAYALVLDKAHPDQAAQLAGTIQDEAMRASLLERLRKN